MLSRLDKKNIIDSVIKEVEETTEGLLLENSNWNIIQALQHLCGETKNNKPRPIDNIVEIQLLKAGASSELRESDKKDLVDDCIKEIGSYFNGNVNDARKLAKRQTKQNGKVSEIVRLITRGDATVAAVSVEVEVERKAPKKVRTPYKVKGGKPELIKKRNGDEFLEITPEKGQKLPDEAIISQSCEIGSESKIYTKNDRVFGTCESPKKKKR